MTEDKSQKIRQMAATVKPRNLDEANTEGQATLDNLVEEIAEPEVAIVEEPVAHEPEPAKITPPEKVINKIIVNIAGGEYTLCGEETKEHLLGIAAIVDSKMMDLKRQYTRQTINKIAILAAIQLADEYVKLSDEYDKLALDVEKLKVSLLETKA